MADYIEILDTQIEPDAPLTAALAAQFRDNPVAITEGSPDALRVKSRAINPEFLPLVNGTGTEITGWTNLDPLTVVEIFTAIFTVDNRTMQIRASNDGGLNYGSWASMTPSWTGSGVYAAFYTTVSLDDGSFESAVADSSAQGISGSLGVSNIDAIQIRGSATAIAYSSKGRAITRVGA